MHRPRLEAAQKPPYDGINGNGRLLSRNFHKMNNSLKDRLVRHMEDGHYEPQSKSELARALNVDSRQKQDFRAIVDQLEEEGRLVRLQKGRYALKRERRNLVHGMIRILRSGKILFLPKKGDPAAADLGWDLEAIPELELKPNHLGTALDGDRVAVRVERKAAKGRRNVRRDRFSSPDTGMKARVEEVTERARSRWLGVFRAGKNKLGRVLGDGVGSPEYIELVEKPAMEVLPGQLVSVEPVSRGEEKKAPRGKIVEVLGYPDDPHVDMEAVIRKYDLPVEFPASVLQEVESFRKNPSSVELGRREDWTDRTVITIDPASARDFDDAISITATPSGWTLAVHIADVSHFVKPGGALDEEALRRGNSTYLPDRVLPMLPPRLSDDLCSLRPDVVRLTKVCEMKFDKKGKMLHARFADAFIRSKARLTYQEAFTMLKGHDKGEVPSMVREAWKLASILRRNRYAKGALDLDFPEVRAVMDKDGRVTIPGFYDDVRELTPAERKAFNKAPFSLAGYKKSLSIGDVEGEAGYTTLERTGVRPSLDVNGIWGGYTGEGTKTVIPSKASAKISMRLVPNQDYRKISRLFEKYFRSIAPKSVKVKVKSLHGGMPYVAPTDMPAYKAAQKAIAETFGKKPLPFYSGGSIPIISGFESILGIKSLLIGFGLAEDAIHSPNESYGLEQFDRGVETIPLFYKYFAAEK